MANGIQQAISNVLGDIMGTNRAKFVSPIPENQVYDTPQKLQAADPGASNLVQMAAIQKARAINPNLKASNSQIAKWYSQYGDKLFQGIAPEVKNAGNAISQAMQSLSAPRQAQAQSQFNVNQPVPTGIDQAMSYIKSQTPNGQDPMKYYKAFQDPQFLAKIQAADQIRPGLSNLLLLQGFHESTLGNASSNIFGALPGGEGSGQSASFDAPSQAVDYQLSPSVMGGGANPNMNLMADKTPLTLGRVQQFYKSYNPEGSYINSMMQTLSQ